MADSNIFDTVGTVAAATISGIFAWRAARNSANINKKVGNGFSEEVQNKLDEINSELKHTKRIAINANDQIRRTRGTVATLAGRFEQHVVEHYWKVPEYGEARISKQRKRD